MRTNAAWSLGLTLLFGCSDPGGAELGTSREAFSFECRKGLDPGCNLSRDPARQVTPKISGTKVVWDDNRSGGHRAIYLYDLVTDVLTEVTPPNTENVAPAIDGNRIVYARLPPDPLPWELYGYDITTHTETLFSTIPRNFGIGLFSVNQERVVWTASRNGNWDIYLHDFQTHAETRITTDPAVQGDPNIFGNRIAWFDRRHGNTWMDVYLYDLSTGVEQRITQGSTMGRAPVLSATRIVWGDIRGGYFRLYEYDFYANPHERALPTQTLVENSLTISGTVVGWVNRNDLNPVFYDDVFLYEIITNQEVRVTDLPALQWFPSLSLPYLVWEDSRKGQPDVFIAKVGDLFYGSQASAPSPSDDE